MTLRAISGLGRTGAGRSAILRRTFVCGGSAMPTVLALTAAMATAATTVLAPAASAAKARPALGATSPPAVSALTLRAMPVGTVSFGRDRRHDLTARVVMYGLTPGLSHNVDLSVPGRPWVVRFSPLAVNGVGQAASTLYSNFTGSWRPGSRLLIRMGTSRSRLAGQPIALTRRLHHPGRRAHRLIPVEVSAAGVNYGTPQGSATISYNGRRHTLTVVVHASGITPGPHAAHIHLGSCMKQGAVKYMLKDLVANRHGRITRAVRVFTNVARPIPARGWYLNIHQGNSGNIQNSHGTPTIHFRPLLCANINGGH
jgi:hypothetical protein